MLSESLGKAADKCFYGFGDQGSELEMRWFFRLFSLEFPFSLERVFSVLYYLNSLISVSASCLRLEGCVLLSRL